MKICFLAPANSIHSYRWVKYFYDKGHEVHWISFYPVGFDLPEGIHFYKLKLHSLLPLNIMNGFISVKRLLKKINPDIFHIHSLGIYGVGAFAGFHPLVVTAWGDDVLFVDNFLFRKRYVQYILDKADCITCDAEHMIEAMANLGADKKVIRQINFGIDTNEFYPERRNDDLRSKLKVFNDPAIISLRNMDPVYDIQSLVRAASLVIKDVPEAKFLIAGTGPEEEKLKSLVKSLGLRDRVYFLGRINNKELRSYLTSMDIYVSTSLSDAGIAASTAEAMACELPVILTDSGENRKWVTDGQNGFIIPVRCPEKLAERIICLIKDERIREKYGKLGRKIIEERNDYYREMKKMEDLYYGLMKH